MAQLVEAEDVLNSAEETNEPKSQSSSRGRATTTKKVVDDSDQSDKENVKEDSDEEDGEEDDEEYEIEAILDVKRGMFKKGEQAFLVKWKGYGDEENCWIPEGDAGNAQELITEFLKARAKEKEQIQRPSARGRKPNSAKISRGTKGGTPDTESVSVSTTKRGRGRAPPSSSDDDEPRKQKKSRANVNTNGSVSARRGTLAALDRTDDEDVAMVETTKTIEEGRRFTTMKALRLATLKSWEDCVEEVSTVERHKNALVVFFLTTNGEYVREPASICAKKFPQKLIRFYESHLRWRSADGDDVSAV